MKPLFSHFLLLSISILSGEPYTAIHVWNITFMTVFLFFFGIIVAECLLKTCIRCNIMCPWQVYGNHLLELVSHWEGHYWTQWGILQICTLSNFKWHFWCLFSGCCFQATVCLSCWLRLKVCHQRNVQMSGGVLWLFLCLTFLLSISKHCGDRGTGSWFSPKVV